MKSKNIILNAITRAKKERGLRVVDPSEYLNEGHIKKANHNLIVMTDLNELGHEDWIVIVAYYAMYHSALAILSKIGLESKEHASTVAVLEYFFGEHIDNSLLEKFNKLKEKKDNLESIKLEEKYIDYLWKIKRSRENVQYGISTSCKETDEIMSNAREFVTKIKLLLDGIDDKLISIIIKEINELQSKQIIMHGQPYAVESPSGQ